MSNLEVICPNIENLEEDEFLKFAYSPKNLPPIKTRVQLIKILYQVLGYDLDKSTLLFLADESEKKLCLAPAGGCKTTTLTAGLVLEKLWRKDGKGRLIRGRSIVCMVYNRHNVSDVEKRHAELVNKLKASGIKGVEHLDNELKVCTVHSFCAEWLQEYEARLGLVGYDLITEDSSKTSIMTSAVKAQIRKFGDVFKLEDINIQDMLSLYNYVRERMIDYSEMSSVDKFIDLNLPIEFVSKVFTLYDANKKIKRKYDYTDLLTIFYKLVTENDDVVERIGETYSMFCADEVQDLTPIIREIIKTITKNKPLTFIGDDDQCIYPFRGADPQNILKFTEHFEGGRVFLLRTNRRCPSNVVELGKFILSMNKNRYNKTIDSINPEGSITYKAYRDRIGQFSNVVKMIKSMSDEERGNTCICYRNSSSSITLSNMLVNDNIHFYLLKGINPFDYGLYKAVFDVLEALLIGVSKKMLFKLYKALPITKQEMADALKYDPVKDKGTDGTDVIEMDKIDFGSKMVNQKFVSAWKLLIAINKSIGSVTLDKYFPALFNCIRSYFWQGMVKYLNMDIDVDNEITESIYKYFNAPVIYIQKRDEHEKQQAIMKRDQFRKTGVALSTFHSLKGLEFKNVILVDLQESIFPNSQSINMKPYPIETKQELLESEARLLYVAVTRAKQNLIMCYSQQDPTCWIPKMIEHTKSEKTNEVSLLHSVKPLDQSDYFDDLELDLEDPTAEPEPNKVVFEEIVPSPITVDKIVTSEKSNEEIYEVHDDKEPVPNVQFRSMLRNKFFK